MNNDSVANGGGSMNKPYVGTRLCPIDPDGSIELPGFLLQLAQERSPNWVMFAGPDPEAPCLCLLDETALAQRLATAGDAKRAGRAFGFFEPAPFFSNGRLQLPGIARIGGWLGPEALLIGAGDRLELWDPEIAATRGCGTVAALALLHRRIALSQEDEHDPLLPLSEPSPRPFRINVRKPGEHRRGASTRRDLGSPARAA